MTLTAHYEACIARGTIHDDPLQRHILGLLQRVADEIVKPRHAWFRQIRQESLKGIYLFGPVGAGKTFLMDLFFSQVQERRKSRVHFHQFMQQVDAQLRQLQGHPDPLKVIAKQIAKSIRLLCLDEFLVQDIATAMILATLLKLLFAEGVVFVITSNTAPDNLYLNGLQRVRFLPAIALIKAHCEVIDMLAHRDYRLGRLPLAKAYIYPINPDNEALLRVQFSTVSSASAELTTISVQGRDIQTLRCGEGVVWFEFDVICQLPRSQLDYLEIAKRFHTIFVSHVPAMTEDDTVRALLFTHFIDVMYDSKVRVIILAEVPIHALYMQGEVAQAFQRTRSRLEEMQSIDY